MRPTQRSGLILLLSALFVLANPLPAQDHTAATADGDLVVRARAIHDRVITLDTHVDINVQNFTAARNYTQRLSTRVDLPKMEEGGLDAVFFVVYVGQDDDFTPEAYRRVYDRALAMFRAIHWLTDSVAPDRIGLALTSADVRRDARWR
jgi:membrane dipeptidase